MPSGNRGAGVNKGNDKRTKKTPDIPASIAKKIRDLEVDIQRLTLENIALKENFNVKEIIKVLPKCEVIEYDATEIANQIVKMALIAADEKHSLEIKKLEMKEQPEEVHEEKENKNADVTKELAGYQIKIKEHAKSLAEKDKEITDMQTKLTSLQTRLKEHEESLVQKDSEITALNDERTRMKQPEEVNGGKENKNAVLMKEMAVQQIKVKEPNDLLIQKDKNITELNKEIASLQERINKTEESLTKLRKENESLQTRLMKPEEEKEITELRKEIAVLKTRLNDSKSSVPSNKSANEDKKLQQLQEEHEKLKNRLSEMAGAQMTYNNPNIADLSDDFRPTKLSEDYSQIYDNEWTDAFEEHSDNKEEDVIEMLRKTLLDSYEFCDVLCKTFTENLQNSTLALPNAKPKTHDVPLVYKKQLQDVKKSFGAFLRKDVKESYWKRNTRKSGEKTIKYVEACVEICWLMVIQEPPVLMELQASKDGEFDSETFKTYTKTGRKVDFVVWPALRLHKGGPLLTKGVAQGKN